MKSAIKKKKDKNSSNDILGEFKEEPDPNVEIVNEKQMKFELNYKDRYAFDNQKAIKVKEIIKKN